MVLTDLRAALALLTRLPLGGWPEGGDAARCVWAYPLVGAAMGLLGGAVYAALRGVGAPSLLAALWALGAMLLATGALHEDGLADSADAFGANGDRARKLDILRDSRIGSFGALALLISTGLRVAAVAALPAGAAVLALAASGALGRGAILVALSRLPPARPDGLGATLAGVKGGVMAAGFAVAAVLALALLGVRTGGVALVAAALAALGMAALARRQIGGFTGDVLGAVSVVAECVALTVIVAG